MRRQGFVGPVAMITVGALFLLQSYTRWDFDDTWPILLIAIGGAMLLQRGFSQPAAPYPPATSQTDSDKVNHG